MLSFEFSAIFLAVALLLTVASAQKNPHYVGNRTTMVHLFEWKWNDIADECERFLGPKGYAGVQVSPITENIVVPGRPWYERYQPISYKWSTRSGNEREFRSMVRRCNRAGVRIYVDAVLNHMTAGQENARGTAGSRAYGKEYPAVPYTNESFHDKCDINYGLAWTVRDCELVGLHDLDQSRQEVQDRIVAFLDRAVDAGVAGFRIDAAKHMWPDHLRQIYARVKNLNTDHGFEPNSRPFIFQEVIDYGNEVVSKYEYNQFAAVLEFKHARELCAGIRGQNPLKWFKTWGPHWGLLPSEDAVTFVDNHDTQRSDNPPLTYKEFRMYKMAVAFMLAHPYGHPRVMSSFHFSAFDQGPPADHQSGNLISPAILDDGTCGNGWVCEHRWRQIFNMVGFRNHVAGTELTNWWDNGLGQVAFCRGNRGFVAINAQHADLRQRLQTCLPAGIYCDLITGDLVDGRCSGLSLRVDEHGWADVEILTSFHDGVVAYHTAAKAA